MTGPPAEPDTTSLVDEFIRRLWAGDEPDPDAIVLAHPRQAAELETQLQNALRVYREIQTFPRLGRYRLASQLGAGSSAVVYRAIDTATHRTVALKVFRPGCRTDRFEQDVRLLLRLKHPNIVQFFETGTADEQPYLAMELIDGGTLATRLASGNRYAFGEAVRLVEKLATAVQYAHDERVIHRDIKPGNVLIDVKGEAQLIDFGLARDLTNPEMTRTGEILGTPLYMAPEQVGGNSHRADARTDVYALGAVLYELLAGRPPFPPTEPGDLARRIAEDTPLAPRYVQSDVPPALEAICLRCLEKEPADRFQTASELADELRHWGDGHSRRVWRPSRAGRIRRWWRRQKLWVRRTVQVAGVLAIACAVLGSSAWSWKKQADTDRRAAELDRRETELAREKHLQEAQARARSDARAALARGWLALQLGRPGRLGEVRHALAEVSRSWPSLPRNEQDAVRFEARTLFAMSLAAHDITPTATSILPQMPMRTWAVAAHPTGEWLAVGTRTRPVRVELGSKHSLDIAPLPLGAVKPVLAFSPDGRFLAFSASSGGVEIWHGDLRQAEPLTRLADSKSPVALALSFSADGADLRVCTAGGEVSVYRTRDWGRREQWQIPASIGTPTAARFAPAGDRLAVGTAAGQVRVVSLGGHAEPEQFKSPARTLVESLAWTSDGRTLAAGFREGRVIIWDEGQPAREFQGRFLNGVGSLEFSRDGRVLCGSRVTSESVFWDRTGRVLLTAPFAVVEFGRDGRSVTTSDTTSVGIGRWVEPGTIRTLRGHETAVGKLAYSADGKRMASVDAGFEGRVWDLGTGELVGAFPLPTSDFHTQNCSLSLSPDGNSFAFASGGRDKSRIVVRDLTTGRVAGPWELPGGFEQLAALGEDRFRLVREEFVGDSEVLETVMYDLDPRNGPRRVCVVRSASPADVRRYFDGLLTPDGRYYAWAGPREPRKEARVEVVDLESRRVIHSCGLSQPLSIDPALVYDWAGRGIDVHLRAGERVKLLFGSGGQVRHESTRTAEQESEVLADWSERLRRDTWPDEWTSRFGLTNATFVPEDRIQGHFQSPENRWLVWADLRGTICLADRKLLFRLVADFDRDAFR